MDVSMELWADLGVVTTWQLDPREGESSNPTNTFSRRGAIAGALALAASLFAVAFLPFQTGSETDNKTYTTAIGEQLTVALSDGSRVVLNTHSSVSVEYKDDARELALLSGEAFFEVASNKLRPFSVDTGSARVTALGTAFNIMRDADTSEITVTEGVVEVREQLQVQSRAPETRVVHADMRVASARGGLDQPSPADPYRVTAWQHGKLPADGMNLAQLVNELQRYHKQRVLIGSRELAQRTMSGVFDLSKPDSIVKALEHSLDVQVKSLEDGSVMLLENPR